MKNLNIVLVQSLYGSNVGATARAMSNFGVSRLILIDRQCEINSKARQAAANGQAPLDERIEYASWSDFMAKEGEGLRIALSARSGKMRKVSELQTYMRECEASETLHQNIYLIFGREDCGLSAEDLSYTHHSCYLKTYGANTSLNLAQAVLLTLSQTRNVLDESPNAEKYNQLEFQQQPALFPESALKEWMGLLGIETSGRKINAYSVLLQMLLRAIPTRKELENYINLTEQTNRKLKQRETLLRKFGPIKDALND